MVVPGLHLLFVVLFFIPCIAYLFIVKSLYELLLVRAKTRAQKKEDQEPGTQFYAYVLGQPGTDRAYVLGERSTTSAYLLGRPGTDRAERVCACSMKLCGTGRAYGASSSYAYMLGQRSTESVWYYQGTRSRTRATPPYRPPSGGNG
eukprot:2355101-Rhodomonas_salina.1